METTRFSGADWADQKHQVILVGAGGIGSWTALNLSRIGHYLYLVDGDVVDATNVNGGQMFRSNQIGQFKSNAVKQICRDFGCSNDITAIDRNYSTATGSLPIAISAVDNMAARKVIFQQWKKNMEYGKPERSILLDGRLLMETMEVFALVGTRKEDIKKYEQLYLFDDKDVPDLDCTNKQTTFGAMMIAGLITATLCNFLTNVKLGMEVREVPFYQRFHLPILNYQTNEPVNSTTSVEEVAEV